jgi:hypothetical protein
MTVRGKVRNGKVVLEKPLALPNSTEVEVRRVKKQKPAAKKAKTPRRSLTERLRSVVGKAKHLQPDASVNHDHYLYGLPRQEGNRSLPSRPPTWPS